MSKAFQDFYADNFSHCYGCGRNNPHGHHLKSHWDGDDTIARFTPGREYSGGVPDNVYGGLIASLLDCHGAASAAAFTYRGWGREMGEGDEPVRYVTASLKVDFRRPTPMGVELLIKGRLRSIDGRKVWVDLSLQAGDELCATGEMLAIRFQA
ncbi:PaaI family thioesterase [Zoogloea sp.]|uniref:PaaI family thioesterase n=1 Tax=Zoogloea sp. TaxID=49181 RepID=UPI00261AE79B|nr:PaaI family thioesterase [uncultured Zoogloea sp.]MCK6389041.1 PaaI family thioesterase [Zoogloea sp.]